MIQRYLKNQIIDYLKPGKVVVLYGPRQIGKTTLIKEINTELKYRTLFLNGEDRFVQEWLSSRSIEILKRNIGDNELVIIDEAQNINEIGLNLKIMVDTFPNLRIMATGSSSFELANQVGEPLVGRKWQFELFPIAQLELTTQENYQQTKSNLDQRLVYGSYPEVITNTDILKKTQILNSVVDNYLFRDILILENLRQSDKLIDILKLLAFQIGKQVSVSELASTLNINFSTVERYLDLLEKVFVIMRVSGFSRNLRKEIGKTSRYYFLDNGVRNAVINNFNDLKTRDDVGQLWENYLFMERLKFRNYTNLFANHYFWRTHDRKEIDLVEEHGGKLYGYEFKWGDKKVKPPQEFLDTYPNSQYMVVNRENYLDFITKVA